MKGVGLFFIGMFNRLLLTRNTLAQLMKGTCSHVDSPEAPITT